eukprot:755824-Hanusia_phi.AAC.1
MRVRLMESLLGSPQGWFISEAHWVISGYFPLQYGCRDCSWLALAASMRHVGREPRARKRGRGEATDR